MSKMGNDSTFGKTNGINNGLSKNKGDPQTAGNGMSMHRAMAIALDECKKIAAERAAATALQERMTNSNYSNTPMSTFSLNNNSNLQSQYLHSQAGLNPSASTMVSSSSRIPTMAPAKSYSDDTATFAPYSNSSLKIGSEPSRDANQNLIERLLMNGQLQNGVGSLPLNIPNPRVGVPQVDTSAQLLSLLQQENLRLQQQSQQQISALVNLQQRIQRQHQPVPLQNGLHSSPGIVPMRSSQCMATAAVGDPVASILLPHANRMNQDRNHETTCAMQPSIALPKDATFPIKLHYILSQPQHNDLIAWASHGECWRVLKPKALEKILPQYFRHGNFSSFQRQLYIWGFRRITSGPDLNSYQHKVIDM